MKAKIGKELLSKLALKDKPYEVYDTEMKGFTLRVQPSGALIFLVRYRWNGKQVEFQGWSFRGEKGRLETTSREHGIVSCKLLKLKISAGMTFVTILPANLLWQVKT